MKIKSIFLFSILFFLMLTLANAQPGGGGIGGGGDPDAPISGIEILLVAGGLMGIRKLVGAKKKSD
jgi:hypothetical protein